MVVGHAGCNGIPRDFIYAFHMPAISGYLYKPHPLVKTIKSFGVPILFFSMVNLALIFGKMLLKGESVDYEFLAQITPPRPSENIDFLLFITVLRAYKAL